MMSNRVRSFMWDYFVEDCYARGVDFRTEDFDAWCDRITDDAIDAAVWG